MSNIHAKESVKSFLAGVKTTIVPELFRTVRRGYTKKNFMSDLMSGLIVGILALPLAIAFAIASGVGPEQGLYTAIIAGFTISLLGGSRFQIGGPTGAFIVRSDNELLRTDVFQKTEDAVDAHAQFQDGLPRELLCVMALGLLLGAAALRGADEAALGAENGGEYGAGVAHGDAHAQSHEDGEAKQADLPTGIAGAALCNEVKNRGSDSGEENKAETDGVAPARDVCDRFKEREQRPGAECGKEHAGK